MIRHAYIPLLCSATILSAADDTPKVKISPQSVECRFITTTPQGADEETPAEQPAASTETPAENAEASAETPAEQPAANTEAPAENAEAPAETPAEQPAASTEAPAENAEAPAETPAEQPAANTEAPAENAEAPAETPAEQPAANAESPSETPAAYVESPVETVEAPAENPEAPAETTEAPAANAESPAETPAAYVESPVETVEAPAENPEAPAETTEAPAETTEAPAETTEAPAETTEAPAETTEAPAETTAAPAETTAAPAETTEAPAETTVDNAEEPAANTEFSVETTTTVAPFTVRLHATPSKGALLWVHEDSTTTLPDITATDAEGNQMIGKFREWEECFDSKDDCHIMVYDFASLPAGGEVIFDTVLEIPVTPGIAKNEAPEFKTTEKSELSIAGITFTIEPQKRSDKTPEQLALLISYTHADRIAEIIICDDKGNHLKSKIVEGDFDPATDKTSALHVVSYKKDKAKLAVRTYKPVVKVKAPVKFKAGIGRRD